MKSDKLIIAVDFDGTCVQHRYPVVGDDIPHSWRVLRRLVVAGHSIILYTMRSGNYLEDAVNWFKERNIPLWGVNENPQQEEWTDSRKVYAQIYIDDAALGCPLIHVDGERPFVNWLSIESMLVLYGALEQEMLEMVYYGPVLETE